jgi:hypothetical protein
MEAEYVTLTAATVATVTIPQPTLAEPVEVPNVYDPDAVGRVYGGVGSVTITVLSGTTPVFLSTDGTDPTVAGDDFVALPGVPGASVTLDVDKSETVTVKAISSGTPMVAVVGN